MSLNKVNMSLDEIINNSRKHKKPLEVVRGQYDRKNGNYHNRKNFGSRNEGGRGRGLRGRGANRGRGRFNTFKRYNNFEQTVKVVLIKMRNSQ